MLSSSRTERATETRLASHGGRSRGSTCNCGLVHPETRYAKSGRVNVAYQVVGDGPRDLVLVSGFVSHLEHDWYEGRSAHFLGRLASFARLIRFDKRGTGSPTGPEDFPIWRREWTTCALS